MKLINYGGQYIDSSDIAAVKKSLRKPIITSGSSVNVFEKKINNFLKCKYSTVCNSGTSAIFLALKAFNINKNDIVLMPAINFISSYNIVQILGAKPILVDVDKHTGQITSENIENCCKKYKIKRFRALIIMYNGGYPIDIQSFLKIKKKYKCIIVEDACHAFGSSYKSKNSFIKVGSCKHSDVCTFSLHPLKTITTGEGGIVTTNNKKINKSIKSLRSHGILRDFKNHWEYDIINNSLNFRLTDFQCELGISQLNKINKFLKKRQEIAKIYNARLKKLNNYITYKFKYKNCKPSYHLLLINLKKPNLILKSKLFEFMKKKKIYLQYHYIPIYKFHIFKKKNTLKNTEAYYRSTFSLPIHFKLKKKDINYIADQLEIFFKNHA